MFEHAEHAEHVRHVARKRRGTSRIYQITGVALLTAAAALFGYGLTEPAVFTALWAAWSFRESGKSAGWAEAYPAGYTVGLGDVPAREPQP